MDIIQEIIQILIALFTSGAGLSVIAILSAVVSIALVLIAKFVPSSKVYGIFHAIGSKVTSKGNSWKYLNEGVYEKVEFTVLGFLKAAYEGFVHGMTSDNE